MRLVLVLIALLLVSLPVSAQPIRPEATACLVTLTDAPDEIREIVDAWLRAAPRCGAALDVTILPVDGGYLLDARDASGGRRVRFAPDAQIAGALIASWASDGRIVLSAPGDVVAAPPAPVIVLAPGATSPPPEPLHHLDHRVLVGALVGAEQGLRGEIDVVALHRVSLGVAVAARTGTVRFFGMERDVAASGYLALSLAAARWQLRVELGAGLQLTEQRMYSTTDQLWASRVDRLLTTDASLTASREVAAGWAVTGGLLVNVLPDPGSSMLDRVVPMALLGVSYRL